VKAQDVLCFASGAEHEPIMGWGEKSSPSVMFIEPDTLPPTTTTESKPPESKLPQARTCGPSILLPLAHYLNFDEFKENMNTGIISSPQILLL